MLRIQGSGVDEIHRTQAGDVLVPKAGVQRQIAQEERRSPRELRTDADPLLGDDHSVLIGALPLRRFGNGVDRVEVDPAVHASDLKDPSKDQAFGADGGVGKLLAYQSGLPDPHVLRADGP